jgi:hypothetical protein
LLRIKVGRQANAIVKIIGGQARGTMEPERGAVKVVSAAFGDDLDLAPADRP